MIAALLRRLTLAAALAAPAAATAGGLLGEPGPDAPSPDAVVVEPFVGYLRGTSGEHAYLSSGGGTGSGTKLSQLDWRVDALAVGGRVAARPLDGLTVRGRFWATVASDGFMTDRDWFAGYQGPSSWTDRSQHPDTTLGKAWQADASAAFKFYEDDELALTFIGGYRQYEAKYNARGGRYLYSGAEFRDTAGFFTPGELGIAYEQVWRTPYAGVGAAFHADDWTVSAELVSGVAFGRVRDHHALRTTLFTASLDPTVMVGANLGLEYRISPVLSLAGRVEYQEYLETRGTTKAFDSSSGQGATFRDHSGAEASTLLVSLGLKARL